MKTLLKDWKFIMLSKRPSNLKWTLNELIELAKPYTTRSQFKTAHQAAYHSTLKQNFDTIVFAHMKNGNQLRAYTLESLIKIAKDCKTREEFKVKNRGAYDAARRMGKLDYVCKHMPKFATQYRYEEFVLHPKIKKLLKKFNLKFEHEFILNKKSRPDFICFNKKSEALIIEIKADCKTHEKLELKKQIEKYKNSGKIKFKNKFKGVILASDQGKHGITFKELESKLSQFETGI